MKPRIRIVNEMMKGTARMYGLNSPKQTLISLRLAYNRAAGRDQKLARNIEELMEKLGKRKFTPAEQLAASKAYYKALGIR